MDPSPTPSILQSFACIDDPRAANAAHPLGTVLFCLLVGVLCGADGFVQAEHAARLKKKFIKNYVPLRKGIPTHDTMARVLGDIDPDQFVRAIASLMEGLSGRPARDIINIDGKTLRGVVGTAALKRAGTAENQAHMVSAFSSLRRVVLEQLRSKRVANEVQAAQELLGLLEVEGAVVTLDAAHTVGKTLDLIVERGADYIVTVKRNAGALHDKITATFKTATPVVVRTVERSRGKDERRTYEIAPAPEALAQTSFSTMKSFVRVTRENVSHSHQQQRHERETFYGSCLPPSEPDLIAKGIRERWGIENRLHHVLDMTFDEDGSRIRTKNAPENFARVRHIALAMLSVAKGPKISYALKRMTAAMDDRYLARTLGLTYPQ